MFDSLADLVEHFKKTGIEEMSGSFVYLKQVNPVSCFLGILWRDPLAVCSCFVPLSSFSPQHTEETLLSSSVSFSHANPLCFPIPSPTMLRG